MAKYDYKGTKITGTSTSAKVFKKSGVSKAKAKDLYFNTSTGHVYKCTEGGSASKAKWKYIRTDIAKKPEKAVTSLGAPVRQNDSRTMRATWSVPGALTDKKSGARAESLKIKWWLGITGEPSAEYETANEARTDYSINLNNVTIGGKSYTRSSFYPLSGTKMTYVTVQVKPHNSKGSGPKAVATRKFYAPRVPSISTPTFDTETGKVIATITTDAGADHYERYDTRYRVTVTNTRTGGKTYNASDSSSTSTSFNAEFNASDYQQLSYNEYIKVVVTAWARGYAGDSSVATNEFYVAYPAQASISGIKVSSRDSSGKCTVLIKTNSTKEHPVDRVKLEYLADVEYARAEDIPGTADWTSTDIIDDASCTALTMPVGDLIPGKGRYTWVRVMSYHAAENVLKRYSEYRRVTDLETPAPVATDDYVAIVDTHAGADGKSVVVKLGWDADGQDDSTGTELTWADEEDAWKSTKAPESHEFSWEDKTDSGQSIPVTYEGITYRRSATITIKGLAEGAKYYIRARRYYDGDTMSYSPYSNTATCITNEKPETVVATCERYVPTGSSLQVNWTLAGNGLQTEWQIVDTNGTVLANGEGSLGSAQIPAEKLAVFADNGSVTFTVQASTGSGFVTSEEHTVTIIDNPELSITVPSTLTAQPFSFTATATTPSDLIVIVSSQGAVGQFPSGIRRQTAGDTIHSAVYSPQWAESQGNLSATIAIPSGLDFWDKGLYTVEVTAIDRETGLRSDTQTASVGVAWSHQAPSIVPVVSYVLTADTEVVEDKGYFAYDSETQAYVDVTPDGDEDPSEEGWYEQITTQFVNLTPVDTVDDTGLHHQAVQIALTPPTGSAQTDVYDIYRMTGLEAHLIGEGFPLTYTAQDEYAPFGDDMTLYYRVAIRTVDGAVSFNDFEYVLEGSVMRFDWDGGSLELPYNISISDSYKKDVEFRKHLNGSTDGYWNQNIERKGKLNSDVIRLDQQDEVNAARLLAKYPGAVFVRTPDGSAYEADVQVSDMSTEGVLTAIAIDATEIGLTAEFILPTPFELE